MSRASTPPTRTWLRIVAIIPARCQCQCKTPYVNTGLTYPSLWKAADHRDLPNVTPLKMLCVWFQPTESTEVIIRESAFMLHELHSQGMYINAIARQTGLDRKTVRRHLASRPMSTLAGLGGLVLEDVRQRPADGIGALQLGGGLADGLGSGQGRAQQALQGGRETVGRVFRPRCVIRLIVNTDSGNNRKSVHDQPDYAGDMHAIYPACHKRDNGS